MNNNNNRIKELQQKLNDNMDKAVKLAEKITIRNEQGQAVMTKDDEWINDIEYDEFPTLEQIREKIELIQPYWVLKLSHKSIQMN